MKTPPVPDLWQKFLVVGQFTVRNLIKEHEPLGKKEKVKGKSAENTVNRRVFTFAFLLFPFALILPRSIPATHLEQRYGENL